MGYATVSEDGSQLITEAGSGISKAGWGGACVYTPGGTASGGAGGAGSGGGGPPGVPPPPCPGFFTPPPRKISNVQIEVGGWNQDQIPLQFASNLLSFKGSATVTGGCTPKYKWDMGDGTTKMGEVIKHTYQSPLKAPVKLTVVCEAFPASACVAPTPAVTAELTRDVYIAKISFLEAWSDQLPGVKVNGHPDKTGNAATPYALMGSRSDDKAYILIKSKVEPNLPAEVNKLLKYEFSSGANSKNAFVKEVVNNDYTSLVVDTKEDKESPKDYKIVVFVDRNLDNKYNSDERDQESLEASSTPITNKNAKTEGWPFQVVSASVYAKAQEIWFDKLNSRGSTFPAAKVILEQFLNIRNEAEHVVNTSPIIVLAADTRNGPGSKTELAHPIGIAKWSGQWGEVPSFEFQEKSLLTQKVLRSSSLELLIGNVLFKERDKLISTFESTNKISPTNTVEFSNLNIIVGKGDLTFKSDLDLFFGLHNTRIENLKISGRIRKTEKNEIGFYIDNIYLTGTLDDYFDFRITQDYLKPFNNTEGAYLQAGYPTLGKAGRVVGQKIIFNKYKTPFDFYIGGK
jgi:hypothetical protein